eukprot:4549220-Amphidinium_carterae.1
MDEDDELEVYLVDDAALFAVVVVAAADAWAAEPASKPAAVLVAASAPAVAFALPSGFSLLSRLVFQHQSRWLRDLVAHLAHVPPDVLLSVDAYEKRKHPHFGGCSKLFAPRLSSSAAPACSEATLVLELLRPLQLC